MSGHYFIRRDYDSVIDVLKNTDDYTYREKSICKLCGFCSIDLRHSALASVLREEKERRANPRPYERQPPPLMSKENRDLMVERADALCSEEEGKIICTRPLVIKTKDVNFVSFLVGEHYKIISTVSLGRSNTKGSSSSSSSSQKGWFSSSSKSKSSSSFASRRMDIAEYTLQRELEGEKDEVWEMRTDRRDIHSRGKDPRSYKWRVFKTMPI